jgi:hypothetical protein
MNNQCAQVFLATTTLWFGLVVSGVSSASQTELKLAGASPLLEVCKVVPEYKKSGVAYSDTVKRDATIRWSRKTWLELFPKRFVYSIPTLEIKLYEKDPQVPRGFDPEEEAAFVLGRVNMPSESGCGLLVLEDGYYSSTRIVLYPVLASGRAGVGLELADRFSDESVKIIVSSDLSSKGQRIRITTKLVESVGPVEPVGDSADTASKKKALKESRHIWEFENKALGFVRVK